MATSRTQCKVSRQEIVISNRIIDDLSKLIRKARNYMKRQRMSLTTTKPNAIRNQHNFLLTFYLIFNYDLLQTIFAYLTLFLKNHKKRFKFVTQFT